MIETDYRLSFAAKKKVQGQLPKKRDVIDWGDSKLMAFLRFVDFFTVDGSFKMTQESIMTADERASVEPFWDEFMARIDVDPGVNGGTVRGFYRRFLTLSRIPLGWLKENPHAVSQAMYEIMDKNPRMQWAAKHFQMVETASGVEIVKQDQDETLDPGRKNATGDHISVDSPLVKFERAKLNMVGMLEALGRSIPMSELKGMPVKDRIAAFNTLMGTAQKIIAGSKPSSVIFNQINVNKAGREELEKSFLDYAETQTEAS